MLNWTTQMLKQWRSPEKVAISRRTNTSWSHRCRKGSCIVFRKYKVAFLQSRGKAHLYWSRGQRNLGVDRAQAPPPRSPHSRSQIWKRRLFWKFFCPYLMHSSGCKFAFDLSWVILKRRKKSNNTVGLVSFGILDTFPNLRASPSFSASSAHIHSARFIAAFNGDRVEGIQSIFPGNRMSIQF